MKVLKIDENAHSILIKVRDEMKKSGIENATISEAIRELDRKVTTTSDYKPEASDGRVLRAAALRGGCVNYI